MTTESEDNAARRRLEVSNLCVALEKNGAPVVDSVSFTVSAGEVLALVGESGSGKSTTGLALLGWARPGLTISDGRVLVDGDDMLSKSPEQLRRARGQVISYVPQDPTSGLNPALRVSTQLREALRNHGVLGSSQEEDERIAEMLVEVGLPPGNRTLDSFPHQLSGGQQQRVAIAMAFACRPRVVVLDEPTTGLDVTTQRRVLETVSTLSQHYGTSAIYVSHDLAVVANIAHATAVMYAGRVVEVAPTSALFAAPRHRYTSGLLAAIPDVDRATRLTGIEGRPPRPGRWPQGCSFAERCAAADTECRATVPALVASGQDHQVRCLHPVPADAPSLAQRLVAASDGKAATLLAVRGLGASYGRTTILHGVDLDVSAGGCTAIVGESGSGKTTLARCIVGLNGRWSGHVTFDGHDMAAPAAKRSPEQRRRIQYVFQNPYASLNPRMTIGQNVEEPLRHFTRLSHRERDARICEVLDAVALNESYFDRMPDQLSGGERQRVAIARALVVEPDVLVCDEVTSALDVSVQALVVERLRALSQEKGLSLLFITHNLAVVRSISSSVVVLSEGHVVEAGPTSAVLDAPEHDYTRRLMADLPRLPLPVPLDGSLAPTV